MYLYALLICKPLCVTSKVPTFYIWHHSFPDEKKKIQKGKTNIVSKNFYSSIPIIFNVKIQII